MNFGGTIRLNRVGVCVIIGACVLFVLYMNTDSIESHKSEIRKSTESVNLKKLLAAAITIAVKGGKEVALIKKSGDIGEKSKGNTKEGVNDPVTKADYNSHCVMYYGLSRSFSGLKIISEEHKEQSECVVISSIDSDVEEIFKTLQLEDQFVPVQDVTVWIDPLDATKEYTENLLQYVTTMVCIAVKEKAVIGVIHKPFEKTQNVQTYWAWREKGNSENFGSKKEEDTDSTKIIVSISHAGTVKNVSEKAFGKNIEIISAAGAGYKSLEVAKRSVDAYVHITHIKKWDICAGNAIIEALGGKMTTLSNSELNYAVDAKPLNEEGLLATMEKHDWYLEKLNSVKKNVV